MRTSTGIVYDVVVPTVGRSSLTTLLTALGAAQGPPPQRVVVVDDRPVTGQLIDLPDPEGLEGRLRWLHSGGRGPAAARNVGWRSCSAEWVVFLDDDVVPGGNWRRDLSADLSGLAPEVVGIQARLHVPLPTDRRPTDWERNVAGLSRAHWATADMAYRRWALEMVGGFDERYPRAFREDADIALRMLRVGLSLERGNRTTAHPPGPQRFAGSLRRQAGNQDDPLMFLEHGSSWRQRAGAPGGRRPLHLLTTALGTAALWSRLRKRPRRWLEAAWMAATAQFTWSRLRGGPRQWRETIDMAVTSVLIPPLAVAHWSYGGVRALRMMRRRHRLGGPLDVMPAPVEAVLFDRDGTLIVDVPHNGDPVLVEPMPNAAAVVARLRGRGLKIGVITNQSGVGRGLISWDDVDVVNRRVEELLGSFDTWQVCPHRPDAGCECRKPAPGMILKAAADLGVLPERCVVVGDVGTDVEAARAAGAGHILVPTALTLPEEIVTAGAIAADLEAAYDKLMPYVGGSP